MWNTCIEKLLRSRTKWSKQKPRPGLSKQLWKNRVVTQWHYYHLVHRQKDVSSDHTEKPQNKIQQNDQVHASTSVKKKDVPAKHQCTQIMLINFSQLLMASAGETKLGYTSLASVNFGFKVSRKSHRNLLLL